MSRFTFSVKASLTGMMLLGCAASALAMAACGGEDRPGVEVEGGGSSTGVGAEPGIVGEKPADATQVDVTLQEWSVIPAQRSVKAGKVYFLVDNIGPEDAHEFVVVMTDLAPGQLPVEDGKVPEDEIDLIDEIAPFTPGSQASLVVNLEPGHYAFICNITETEDGEIESHYQLGMWAEFEVTE